MHELRELLKQTAFGRLPVGSKCYFNELQALCLFGFVAILWSTRFSSAAGPTSSERRKRRASLV